jgi:hypothetical protein
MNLGKAVHREGRLALNLEKAGSHRGHRGQWRYFKKSEMRKG